ncbi:MULTISPECIES: GNAT family N-acetyltransferase [Gammaproteobacteria]|uniref:GNAT family N-acetyltransferase n=1 Tax=Gammaproteobacteria TaxID=1236 RepID=UPI001AD96E6A|nr:MULTISPECIES: GNAT family N-acetyltransferase [Gammaproteobacteria]MBO9482870.1 N-acetyltransferase [Salinisphaera sp. G21_0]MBO9496123.1 N-acetyltransferase [Thalassotalea sp. G20_0]
MIRTAKPDDCAQIADIYNTYVLHSTVTFEVNPVTPEEINQRLKKAHCFLVYEQDGEVLGYAYAAHYHARAAYRYTAEGSIYLRDGAGGRGMGTLLYQALFSAAKALGIREMIGVIALPNQRSEALHQKLGYRKVGVMERCGVKFDQVIDTSIWQRSLIEEHG